MSNIFYITRPVIPAKRSASRDPGDRVRCIAQSPGSRVSALASPGMTVVGDVVSAPSARLVLRRSPACAGVFRGHCWSPRVILCAISAKLRAVLRCRSRPRPTARLFDFPGLSEWRVALHVAVSLRQKRRKRAVVALLRFGGGVAFAIATGTTRGDTTPLRPSWPGLTRPPRDTAQAAALGGRLGGRP